MRAGSAQEEQLPRIEDPLLLSARESATAMTDRAIVEKRPLHTPPSASKPTPARPGAGGRAAPVGQTQGRWQSVPWLAWHREQDAKSLRALRADVTALRKDLRERTERGWVQPWVTPFVTFLHYTHSRTHLESL